MKNADILGRLIEILNKSIGGFADIFVEVALSIVIVLFTIELIKSALDLVTGKGVTITKKFILYISLIIIIGGWGKIYHGVCDNVVSNSGLKKNFSLLWKKVIIKHELPTILLSPRGLKGIINSELDINLNKADFVYILKCTFAYISLFISLILLTVVIIVIGKSYAIFLIQMSLGIIPVTLMMSPETRATGIMWIKTAFARFLTIILYSFSVKFSLDFIHKNIKSINSIVPGILDMDFYIPTVLSILLILFMFRILSKVTSAFFS